MTTEIRDADVVVIGGGIAGLTAAYRLQALHPGCRIIVIEAKDRLGGRTYTVDLEAANGSDKWDLGGQWVSGKQHHVLWLLEELGLETYGQYREGRHMMQLGGDAIKSYTSDGLLSMTSLPFSMFTLMDMAMMDHKLEKLVKQVPRDDPRKCKNAEKWDSMTAETLFNSITWKNNTREIMSTFVQTLSGGKMSEMSALSVLHGASTSGGEMEAEELKVAGGVQQVSELLADRIGRDNLIISDPVTLIDQSDEDKVEITMKSGGKCTCRYVINSSPLHCSVATDYKPVFPLTRQSLAARSPMGHLLKFIITYKTAFWREKGLSGVIIGDGGDAVREDCDNGPVGAVLDSQTAFGNPALVGFYAKSWQWRLVPLEERKEAVFTHLTKFLGPEAKDSLEYMDIDWSAVPFIGGCPGSLPSPGAMTTYFDGFRTPLDRVHWAGAETATIWSGYLSGAVQSGMRASEEVLARLDPGFEGDPLLKELDQKHPEISG